MEQPLQSLHPIIDDILDYVRKRTQEVDGRRQVVEEFVIPDEFILPLENKLKAIVDEEEKKEAMLSIIAFSMMVEKQGWKDNAQKIRDFCKVYGDAYLRLEQAISIRLLQRDIRQGADFFNPSNNPPMAPDILDIEEGRDSMETDFDDDFI